MSGFDMDKCFIFGAGIYGKTALLNHERHDVDVLGFLDNDEAKDGKVVFHKLKCCLPSKLSESERELPILIAIKKSEVRKAIRVQLEQQGYNDIRDYGEDDIYAFWKELSDEDCIRLQWAVHMGEECELDLKNPRTFNEKIQWLKLHDRNPLYTSLVDKYAVKEWVSNHIGSEYVIPTLGVWAHFDDIDFSELPDKFVLKCTHDSGSIVFCCSQSSFDKVRAKNKLEKCLSRNIFWSTREWPYLDVYPRIIAEPLLAGESEGELMDYKLLCFNGRVESSFVCSERYASSGLKVTFYDRNWQRMPFERHYKSSSCEIPKPVTYREMACLAEKLSTDIPFVRVDFYEIDGRPYFGEMTFYPGSGYEEFRPEFWDRRLGDILILPQC